MIQHEKIIFINKIFNGIKGEALANLKEIPEEKEDIINFCKNKSNIFFSNIKFYNL
jgi:hypothetical protein